MKKFSKLTAGVMAAGLSAAGMVGVADPAQASPGCTAVFLSPHQDDETLSMGAAIEEHVKGRGGSKVCVALMTTGRNSGAKLHFDESRQFIPAAGRTTPYYDHEVWSIAKGLAPNQAVKFGQARDQEFILALLRQGIPRENIYLDNLPGYARVFDYNTYAADGIPTNQGAANRMVAAARGLWPNADFKTTTHLDTNNADHESLGAALAEQTPSNSAHPARFYVPSFRLSLYKGDRAKLGRTQGSAPTRNAALAYGHFNAARGYYGIGWLSVAAAFGGPALTLKTCVYGKNCTTPRGLGTGIDKSLFSDLASYTHT